MFFALNGQAWDTSPNRTIIKSLSQYSFLKQHWEVWICVEEMRKGKAVSEAQMSWRTSQLRVPENFTSTLHSICRLRQPHFHDTFAADDWILTMRYITYTDLRGIAARCARPAGQPGGLH